jgi:hypothetical protein
MFDDPSAMLHVSTSYLFFLSSSIITVAISINKIELYWGSFYWIVSFWIVLMLLLNCSVVDWPVAYLLAFMPFD